MVRKQYSQRQFCLSKVLLWIVYLIPLIYVPQPSLYNDASSSNVTFLDNIEHLSPIIEGNLDNIMDVGLIISL